MLALGVIVVSRSQSFAVDLTGFLFGDVFAVRTTDLVVLAVALLLTLGAVIIGHRAFVAVTFDPRKAATLGLRPQWAIPALTALHLVRHQHAHHCTVTLGGGADAAGLSHRFLRQPPQPPSVTFTSLTV